MSDTDMPVVRGRIIRLNDRGFGFILADGDNPKTCPPHFFHANDVRLVGFHQLRVGQAVQFESHPVPRGLAAKFVEPID